MMYSQTMDAVVRNILECAWAEFAKNGFNGTRIETIIERTNTSKRMLYYHFGSKSGLYERVIDYAYGCVGPPHAIDMEGAGGPMEALRNFVGSAFDKFHRYPDFVRLSLHENLNGAMVLKKLSLAGRANTSGVRLLDDLLKLGQSQGLMRTDVSAIDVYLNFVGLCYYNIATANSYKVVFGIDVFAEENLVARREAIIDSVLRYVAN